MEIKINLFDIRGGALSISSITPKKLIFLLPGTNITDQDQEMIKNITTALGLKYPDEIEQVNIQNERRINVAKLIKSTDNVVSLGVSPKQMRLNVEHKPYKILYLENCQLLFVDDIDQIKSVKEKKVKFWLLLKKMFRQT